MFDEKKTKKILRLLSFVKLLSRKLNYECYINLQEDQQEVVNSAGSLVLNSILWQNNLTGINEQKII